MASQAAGLQPARLVRAWSPAVPPAARTRWHRAAASAAPPALPSCPESVTTPVAPAASGLGLPPARRAPGCREETVVDEPAVSAQASLPVRLALHRLPPPAAGARLRQHWWGAAARRVPCCSAFRR